MSVWCAAGRSATGEVREGAREDGASGVGLAAHGLDRATCARGRMRSSHKERRIAVDWLRDGHSSVTSPATGVAMSQCPIASPRSSSLSPVTSKPCTHPVGTELEDILWLILCDGLVEILEDGGVHGRQGHAWLLRWLRVWPSLAGGGKRCADRCDGCEPLISPGCRSLLCCAPEYVYACAVLQSGTRKGSRSGVREGWLAGLGRGWRVSGQHLDGNQQGGRQGWQSNLDGWEKSPFYRWQQGSCARAWTLRGALAPETVNALSPGGLGGGGRQR